MLILSRGFEAWCGYKGWWWCAFYHLHSLFWWLFCVCAFFFGLVINKLLFELWCLIFFVNLFFQCRWDPSSSCCSARTQCYFNVPSWAWCQSCYSKWLRRNSFASFCRNRYFCLLRFLSGDKLTSLEHLERGFCCMDSFRQFAWHNRK